MGGGDDPCLEGDFCNCTGELSEEGNLLRGIDNCSKFPGQQVLSSHNFYLFQLEKKTNSYKKCLPYMVLIQKIIFGNTKTSIFIHFVSFKICVTEKGTNICKLMSVQFFVKTWGIYPKLA